MKLSSILESPRLGEVFNIGFYTSSSPAVSRLERHINFAGDSGREVHDVNNWIKIVFKIFLKTVSRLFFNIFAKTCHLFIRLIRIFLLFPLKNGGGINNCPLIICQSKNLLFPNSKVDVPFFSNVYFEVTNEEISVTISVHVSIVFHINYWRILMLKLC